MKVAVKLFARARDLAGTGCVEFEIPEFSRVADMKAALSAQVPALAPLVPNLLVAIGTSYADDGTPLLPDADIACFPPVSGG